MAKYRVTLLRTLREYTFVDVEGASVDDAIDNALELADSVEWDAEDYGPNEVDTVEELTP